MPRSGALEKTSLHLKPNIGKKTSAHQLDLETYTHEESTYTPWITKLNKHVGKEGVDASLLEVGFSAAASIFIKPGLTPRANIIIENQGSQSKVVGVASENFNVNVKQQMDKGTSCYIVDAKNWEYKQIVVDITQANIDAERSKLVDVDIISDDSLKVKLQLQKINAGVNFLDRMPKNFFAELMQKHDRGDVTVDMESLASIFTASYVLEEDDLHKGNIGFYVTDAQDGSTKKKFIFFKIDHDLMFADSIMSQKDMRVANIFYTRDSFKMSTRDLDGFPDLRDSGNHYWPTKKRFMSFGDKAYDSGEIQAFAQLRTNPSFEEAKWKYFLKSALMTRDLIDQSLTAHLDPEADLDKINVIKHSIWERIAQLKECLLASEKFKEYLAEKGDRAFEEIKVEIFLHCTSELKINKVELERVGQQLQESFDMMKKCATEEGLSALHKSILLDRYAFSPVLKPTKEDVDVVMAYVKLHEETNKPEAFKFACIAQHLIKRLDRSDLSSAQSTILCQFKKHYLNPEAIKTHKEFEDAANKIRASNLPLKQQKNEILAVLKQSKLSIDALKELKENLKKDEPDSPALKFIAQLRSELWIVRLAKKIANAIVGASAKQTETSSLMIQEIDTQIKQRCSGQQHTMKDRLEKLKEAQVVDPTELHSQDGNKPPSDRM